MTPLSEFFLTAESIVYGFAIARLLHGAPGIFTINKSSITVIIVWITCCLHISVSLWSSTNRFGFESLDFLDFNLVLIYSGITYFMCDSITPHNAEKIESWHSHYLSIRNRYWICHTFLALDSIMKVEYSAKHHIGEMYEVLYVFILIPWILISLFGYFAKSEKIQLIAVTTLLLFYCYNSFVTFLSSSALVE